MGETAAAPRDMLRPVLVETHTGLVVMVGDLAYKSKKAVVTDFLDFATPARRAAACDREVELNRRLAPASYLGVGHFTAPQGGEAEPVIVMRRHPDERRLATMVRRGDDDVPDQLAAVADVLARFHATADRGPQIDRQARGDAVAGRWRENLDELDRYAAGPVPGLDPGRVAEIRRLVENLLAGRAAMFDRRIADQRIVDGHADLLADDIFCLADGPALLDCLEFDDRLRYVDVIDDAAFLAMDLEFLGRADLAGAFLDRYRGCTGDDAPPALVHSYIAYRAVVRAKVECVRVTQGHPEAAADAGRHLQIAVGHLRRGAVRLILVGGAPGTGKTTLARSLAGRCDAQVLSTDDIRAELAERGEITGEAGTFGAGRYSRANTDAVYAEVLSRARETLRGGRSVILDGTWHAAEQRHSARDLATETASALTQLVCVAPLSASVERIRTRKAGSSEVTPDIAVAMADRDPAHWPEAHRIDTTGEPAESVAAAAEICFATT